MNRDEIIRLIDTSDFHPTIYLESDIDSTNSYAKRLLRNGLTSEAIIIAERQNQGKGRANRIWYSPLGGLYMTLVLRRECQPHRCSLFSFVLALSISQVLEKQASLQIDLKWPNDILVSGKKIGGILSELEVNESEAPVILLGVGINLNVKVSDFPSELFKSATSVLSETGNSIHIESVIAQIVNSMDSYLIQDPTLSSIVPQYRPRCITIGKHVSVQSISESFVGQAMDITIDGSLLVRHESGMEKVISAGEVIHLEGG
ncbi:MAG: biotin--[acetyl-CoA-carboxylase] ligase [Candidatus Thorarchaeota archaeon]